MSKSFTEEDLRELLSQWNGDFLLKKHDGEIRGVELTKKYTISKASDNVNEFILKITRKYRFLICEKLEHVVVLTIHVRPDSKEEFLSFCQELPGDEQILCEGA
jgi:hypothetical protein